MTKSSPTIYRGTQMTEPRDSKITLTYSSKWNDMSSRSGFVWGETIPEESLILMTYHSTWNYMSM
jgi:hypothetical protein